MFLLMLGTSLGHYSYWNFFCPIRVLRWNPYSLVWDDMVLMINWV